jgi:hypothetical protein
LLGRADRAAALILATSDTTLRSIIGDIWVWKSHACLSRKRPRLAVILMDAAMQPAWQSLRTGQRAAQRRAPIARLVHRLGRTKLAIGRVPVLVMQRSGEVAMALDEAATTVSLWAARALESVG